MRIHQSSLSSMARCGEQHRRQLAGEQGRQLSATAFGSVMHVALHTLERHRDLDLATKTFEYYWHPHHIEMVCPPVEVWIIKQTYSNLLARGRETLKRYWDLKRYDEEEVLALEYPFVVDLPGTWDEDLGAPHQLAGTVDRLAVRYHRGRLELCIDDWKGLSRSTPLPTPTGWTTMGAVQVGDDVLGSDGRPVRVTAKSEVHERDCYRVTFDDSSSIVADDVHLWTVQAGPLREAETITISTRELARRRARGDVLRIANAEPLQLPDVDLPIDPYVLGCWLGDGSRNRGVITKPDEDLFDAIRARGYATGVAQIDRRSGCQTRTILGLSRQLADAGYLGHKAVPAPYLRASFRQRLDLLRGLMDTDGSWNRGRRRAVFSSVDKVMAHAVQELAVSLGWKALTFTVERHGFGKTVTAYDVCFTPVSHNPFSLPRKADLVDTLDYPWTQRPWRRSVRSVEQTVSVPTQCIQVDARDSLYLCGEQMVPTHNTGKKPLFLAYNVQFSAYAYATTRPEFWTGATSTFIEGFGAERGAELSARFAKTPRHGWWINVMGGPDWLDAGRRVERDYQRLFHSIEMYSRAVKAGIFQLNIVGEICRWCPFNETCPEGIEPVSPGKKA